jgi:hypothetical protein
MKHAKVLLMPVIIAAMVLSGAGCSKLTKQNYDMIKVGMEYKEVAAILGDRAACDAAVGAKSCVWGDQKKNITVNFIADKVVFKTGKGI